MYEPSSATSLVVEEPAEELDGGGLPMFQLRERQAELLGELGVAIAAVDAELQDPRTQRIRALQRLDRRLDVEDHVEVNGRSREVVGIELGPDVAGPTALRAVPATRVGDEDVAHDVRREAAELRGLPSAGEPSGAQPQEGLVHQLGRPKRVAGPLAGEVSPRDLPELLVDLGVDVLQCALRQHLRTTHAIGPLARGARARLERSRIGSIPDCALQGMTIWYDRDLQEAGPRVTLDALRAERGGLGGPGQPSTGSSVPARVATPEEFRALGLWDRLRVRWLVRALASAERRERKRARDALASIDPDWACTPSARSCVRALRRIEARAPAELTRNAASHTIELLTIEPETCIERSAEAEAAGELRGALRWARLARRIRPSDEHAQDRVAEIEAKVRSSDRALVTEVRNAIRRALQRGWNFHVANELIALDVAVTRVARSATKEPMIDLAARLRPIVARMNGLGVSL